MTDIRIHVIGAVRLSDAGEPRLSPSLQQLIAVLAAVGPNGISRDELARELWGDPPPESWKSALRNRITSARRLLGSDSILSASGHLRLAASVPVDSWELIDHNVTAWTDAHDLGFLDDEPLLGMQNTRLLRRHATEISDARAALLRDTLARYPEPLSQRALQSLRSYQRLHPFDSTVSRETIRALVRAGEIGQAESLIDEIKSQTKGARRSSHPWVEQLDGLIVTGNPRRRREDRGVSPSSPTAEQAEIARRAELFASAAREQDWSIALEVAMSGLPEASKMDGDPERLELLEAIPLDKIDPARRFTLSLSMSQQLMYVGREEEARQWSLTTRELAQTSNEEQLAFLTRVIVGDVLDERTPITVPAPLNTNGASTNMVSLQVAVMNHLERALFADAAQLRHRFNELVEASADPYRRWHKLLITSMVHFVDGELDTAADVATRAYKYGQLFGIVDADIPYLGHLSNATWIHNGFDISERTPASARVLNAQLGRAIQAARRAEEDDTDAADVFLRDFNWQSRSFFTFPTLMIVAGNIRDPALRAQVSERLKRRSGTSAIWGSGVLHLGPVDRMLARLTDDPLDQEMHAAAAVDIADRQRTRIWQVITRLDLEAITGDGDHRRRAEEYATTKSLQTLVSDYNPAF